MRHIGSFQKRLLLLIKEFREEAYVSGLAAHIQSDSAIAQISVALRALRKRNLVCITKITTTGRPRKLHFMTMTGEAVVQRIRNQSDHQ